MNKTTAEFLFKLSLDGGMRMSYKQAESIHKGMQRAQQPSFFKVFYRDFTLPHITTDPRQAVCICLDGSQMHERHEGYKRDRVWKECELYEIKGIREQYETFINSQKG